MKNFLPIILLFISFNLSAQQKNDYTRSSLHLHLVDDFDYENGDYVLNSYEKFEFPENYNDHTIDFRKVKLSDFELTDAEKDIAGEGNNALGNMATSVVENSTSGVIELPNNSLVKLQLDKYIKENKIAHELIKKWWNIQNDGGFNTDLVNFRSIQNLSEETKKLAAVSGSGSINQFNGLISNTFLVFTRLNYVSNKIVAESIRQVAYETLQKLPGFAQSSATKAADKIYEKTSEGYSVWTTSWLYQLEWDKILYKEFVSTISENKKIDLNKFNKINFQLNYLDQEKVTSLVTFSLKKSDKDRTKQDVFDLATIRNRDKVLVKLQKNNDVFKPIFPLQEGFAIAAGTKEGIEGGDKFEVLETKDGEYNRIGKMKIDEKKIWDNSWNSEDIKPGLTYFKKGSKKYIPGIHYVRLIK